MEENAFCAQDQDENGYIGTCMGDSGGPLVVKVNESDNHYDLLGITSYGYGIGSGPLCTSASVAVFGDVSYFLNKDGWLKTALQNGATCGGNPIIPQTKLSESLVGFKYKEIYISEENCKRMCSENPKCEDMLWTEKPNYNCQMVGVKLKSSQPDQNWNYEACKHCLQTFFQEFPDILSKSKWSMQTFSLEIAKVLYQDNMFSYCNKCLELIPLTLLSNIMK